VTAVLLTAIGIDKTEPFDLPNQTIWFLQFRPGASGSCLIRVATPASLSILVSEKLTRHNFRLWCAQVLPAIHVTQLEGFIDGLDKASAKTIEVEKDSKTLVVPNPDYAI
jgi:hypothetical protein